MNINKNILLVNTGQFGYQAGYYFYAKYLRDDFNVSVISYDFGLPKIKLDNVKIIYINGRKNKILRFINYITFLFTNLNKFQIIFISYFKLCSIIPLFSKNKNIILDIRTGSVSKKKILRNILNTLIKHESDFFRNINVLNQELISLLNLNENKCNILPLGSENYSRFKKNYNDLKLLYIGTLNGRNIESTIIGLKLFLEKNSSIDCNINYDIVAFGSKAEINKINNTIKSNSLSNIVKFHGRKNIDEIGEFFNNSNIGVSYIPMTNFYDIQTPTKTYEYIISGLFCIATNTTANKKLINKDNGILCDDNATSFSNALMKLYKFRGSLNHKKIENSHIENKWGNLVENNLKLFLNRI